MLQADPRSLSARASGVCVLLACLATLLARVEAAPSASQVPTPSNTPSGTPRPTFLSTTRFAIDKFNYTFALSSDEPLVSVGSFDEFQDNIGSARSTAVLFRTPVGNGQKYDPIRCDVLFYKRGGQSRDDLSDFVMTLYADDDTEEHNPGQQVRIGMNLPFAILHISNISCPSCGSSGHPSP